MKTERETRGERAIRRARREGCDSERDVRLFQFNYEDRFRSAKTRSVNHVVSIRVSPIAVERVEAWNNILPVVACTQGEKRGLSGYEATERDRVRRIKRIQNVGPERVESTYHHHEHGGACSQRSWHHQQEPR